MRKLILTLGLLGTFAVLTLSLGAQVNRQDNRRQADRVCVYENNFYGGWEQCFAPGEQIGDLGAHANKISSIRVFGNARVTVFADKNFRGTSLEVTSDMNDLAQVRNQGPLNATWNDRIESITVTSLNGRYTNNDNRNDGRYDPRYDSRNDPRYDPRNDPRYDRRDDDRYRNERDRRTGVCVYDDINFRGRSQCFERGEEVADLGRSGNWNDRISSIQVFGGTRVTLYRDVNYRGERVTIDRDVPDLRQLRSSGFNWDNQISSLDLNNSNGRAVGRNSRY
jgi:hypothetical protein